MIRVICQADSEPETICGKAKTSHFTALEISITLKEAESWRVCQMVPGALQFPSVNSLVSTTPCTIITEKEFDSIVFFIPIWIPILSKSGLVHTSHSAVSISFRRIKFGRKSTSQSAAAFLLHVRLVLLCYPTEMRHWLKHVSAVSNLISVRNKTCSPCLHSQMKTEANVSMNLRADWWIQ